MNKLTSLEQLRAASLEAQGLIAEVASTAADAIGEIESQLGDVGTVLDEINGEGTAQTAPSGVPSGGILIWHGAANAIPSGWALCDGTNGTPDLRGKFVLGNNDSHAIGSTGGAETVKLAANQMPSHTHVEYFTGPDYTEGAPAKLNYEANVGKGSTTGTYVKKSYLARASTFNNLVITTGSAGGTAAHNNMPPYYTLAYIMKL